jgi:PKD domain
MVALRAHRTTLLGLSIFVGAICAWLGAAPPATATITSVSVSNQSLAESQSFSGTVATFSTDDPFDTFSATIDWGDGSTQSGPATLNGNSGSVSGNHTYIEDGTYTLNVTVTESGGSPSVKSASASVTVVEADAALVAVSPITVNEGTSFSGPVAHLIDSGSPDPASKFSATIDWGDGTTTVGTVAGSGGNFTISGSHAYADELANGVIKVKVSEAEGNAAIGVQDQINVKDADTLIAHPLTFPASDGIPFNGTVATFLDTSTTAPASGFTATINWGDGSSTRGTVGWSGAMLTVSGSHTYNSPPASYAVNVELTDDSPGTATANAASTASVSPGKPSAVTQGANAVRINGATLNGTVNPDGDATTYSFQFGKTNAYGSGTRHGTVGSGNSGRQVSASISGLTPGTTYHYRVVAGNSKGTTVGADHTFMTIAVVARLKERRNGTFLVVVNAPGRGTADVVVMAGKTVFGHARRTAKRVGRLTILVHPNRRGRRLIKDHRHHVRLRVIVTFTPQHGPATTSTFRGLHVPA